MPAEESSGDVPNKDIDGSGFYEGTRRQKEEVLIQRYPVMQRSSVGGGRDKVGDDVMGPNKSQPPLVTTPIPRFDCAAEQG